MFFVVDTFIILLPPPFQYLPFTSAFQLCDVHDQAGFNWLEVTKLSYLENQSMSLAKWWTSGAQALLAVRGFHDCDIHKTRPPHSCTTPHSILTAVSRAVASLPRCKKRRRDDARASPDRLSNAEPPEAGVASIPYWVSFEIRPRNCISINIDSFLPFTILINSDIPFSLTTDFSSIQILSS